jgi:hypothetical protein
MRLSVLLIVLSVSCVDIAPRVLHSVREDRNGSSVRFSELRCLQCFGAIFAEFGQADDCITNLDRAVAAFPPF